MTDAYCVLNGMPRSCSSLRDSSSVFAVVTTEMFIPRAYLRKFALCRLCFRQLALEGDIAGVTKSSW